MHGRTGRGSASTGGSGPPCGDFVSEQNWNAGCYCSTWRRASDSMKIIPCIIASTLSFFPVCHGQLVVSALDTATTITFDATLDGVSNGQFAGTGFQSSPASGQLDSDAWAATGWSDGALSFGGTRVTASTDYTRGNATSAQTTGGFYSFGTTDRQLMIQPGGSDWAPGTLTLRVQNTTGSTASYWRFAYDLFVRNDQSRASSFNFSYSTDNTTYVTTGLLSPLFTYTSTAAADASPAWNKLGTPTNTVVAAVPNNGFLYLRWSGADVSGGGSRDEFGLDNISVTAVPEPSITLLGGLGLLGLLRRRR